MQQIRALIQLLEKEFSLRAISSQLGVSRQTVTLYAARLKQSSLSFEALRQLSDAALAAIVYAAAIEANTADNNSCRQEFNARLGYFLTELKRTGVTRLLLWEEYCRESVTHYQYTQFCILLRQEKKNAEATMNLVHSPAVTVMIDFAGDKMSYVDRSTGEVRACPVLVAVLPYSKYTFVMALPDATIPQVIKALNFCLQYFCGVPFHLLTDNMKQLVTKSCRYEPLFSEAIRQWALHYNITLLATRVGKPRDKGAVENEVKIAYQRIYAPLRDRIFYHIDELNEAVKQQLNKHNAKNFQLKDHSRLQQFKEEEQPFLQPLPPESFIIKHQAQAKVQKNYHITLGENYHHYSVPYQHIGKKVSAVYDTDIVEIYYQHQRIALHRRSYKEHGFTTVGDHMPSTHQIYKFQQGYTPEYFLDQALRIGVAVHRYVGEVLKARAYTEQTYNACRGILRLHLQYGPQRLEAACQRALQGQVFNYRTLHNILVSKQDQLSAPHQPELFDVPEHTNLRGPEAYQ